MAQSPSEIIQQALAEALDPTLASFRESLAARLVGELETARREAAADAARQTRAALAEALQVAVRRLRHASSITEIGGVLLETAAGYCGRVALLIHKGETLAGWRSMGFDRDTGDERGEAWSSFQVRVSEAPALAQAIDTREAVVSLAVPDHLSPSLVSLLGLPPEEKVYLFPLCLRQTVVAVVYADGMGATDPVQPAALELLSAVAEISMEALSSRPHPRGRPGEGEPDKLELAARPTSRPAPTDWDSMAPDDRDMHLRAQRFARVLVADLQLYRSREIGEGKRDRDLYHHLREEIDKSREVYQRKFGESAAAGVDYFHLELLRTLAEDQEEVLGPEYPGPIVAPAA